MEAISPSFKEITVTRALKNTTRAETYAIGVVRGTVPGHGPSGATTPRTHHRVVWEDQALVIVSGSHTDPTAESGVWDERREVWSLDASGRLRVIVTTRSSVDASKSVTLVYRRQ